MKTERLKVDDIMKFNDKVQENFPGSAMRKKNDSYIEWSQEDRSVAFLTLNDGKVEFHFTRRIHKL